MSSPSRIPFRRRPVAAGVLVSLLSLLVGLLGTAAAAAPPSPPTVFRAEAAAGWLARQLVDEDHFEVVFDGVAYPDQGLTIDAVFAFAAANDSDYHAGKAMAWLARPDVLTGYIGDGTEAYAGATAKLALAAQVRGTDPSTFGGVDLIARLLSLQAPGGRFSDQSAWGDFSNTFGQSFAVLALDRTAAGAPSAAVDFLANSQCADGGFPASFDAPVCTSDVDATAMAVQALVAAGRYGGAHDGATWLAAHQLPNGSFAAAGATTANANSTGLATQALFVTLRFVPALKGRAYVVTSQLGCAAPAARRGAVPYDDTGFDARASRATAQAVLGLSATGYADLSAAGDRSAAPVLACAAS